MSLHDDPNRIRDLVATSEPELHFPAEALNEIRQERLLSVDNNTTFPPSKVEIVAGQRTVLYVVLPTGVQTPLPFACNAPFIQRSRPGSKVKILRRRRRIGGCWNESVDWRQP